MNIDFSACATFKGEDQKPLITERLVRLGRPRPSIKEIAETAIKRGLDGVVLRSFSHPQGTDNRWQTYKQQMEGSDGFSYLGRGMALYESPNSGKKLLLIHGQGLASNEGSIQVLFAEGNVGERGDKFNPNFYDLVRRARESGEGTIITAARPYNWNLEALKHVDAVETWNGMDSLKNNEIAVDTALIVGKPGVYVSNSKCLRDLGSSYTELDVFGSYQSPDGIVSAIRTGLNLRLSEKDLGGKRRNSTLSKLVHGLAKIEVTLTRNKD